MNMNANLDLLDMDLDELADLPEFKVFPAGAHRVTISWANKVINNKPSVELNLTMIEVLELADPNDATVINAGDSCGILFMLKNNDGSKNEISEGQLKKIMTELRESGVEGRSVAEIMENSQGMECIVVTTKKEDKKNPGTFRAGVSRISLA